MQFKTGILSLFDLVTDLLFTYTIYNTFHELREYQERVKLDEDYLDPSRPYYTEDEYNTRKTHYFIAFAVSLLASATPIMYRLSCTIVIKFS